MRKIKKWLPLTLFCFTFLFTLLNLLSYTTLIGDDAAFHLVDSLQIIKQEPLRIKYPILFRTLLAPFLHLTGAYRLPEALLIFKILASAIAGFSVLATFIYVKETLGFSPAILSAFFIAISQKNMQMLGWGGLPNFTSLGLYPIVLLMYLRIRGRSSSEKKGLKILFFLIIISVFLFHYWSGAILLTILTLYQLFSLKITKKNIVLILSLLTVLLLFLNFGPIGPTFRKAIEKTIFLCTQREALIHLGLIWREIISLFDPRAVPNLVMRVLAVMGLILLIQRIPEGENERGFSLIMISWLLVPLMLLFSITYEVFRSRFLYFLTYPFYILTSIAITSILRYTTRAIKLLALFFEGPKKSIGRPLLSLALASLFILPLISLNYESMSIIGENLQLFYPQSSEAIINSINWAQNFTPPNSTIVSTTWGGTPLKKGPSHWMMLTGRIALRSMPILSDLTIEITTGTFRVYEGVFNHQENPKIEFHVINPFKDGNELMVSFREVRSMLSYNDSGTEVEIPLSEYQERTIQILTQSEGATWLTSKSTYKEFALKKVLRLRDDSSTIELYYNITTNQRLEDAYLTINYFLPNTTFNKILIPGILEWGSPWDKPTQSCPDGGWASILSTSNSMTQALVAYTNPIDNILAVLRFNENPPSITVNSTGEGGIHESTFTFPLGTLKENQTKSIKIELGFFNIRSRWNPISLDEITQLFETHSKISEVEIRGLQDTIDIITKVGPVYVMSEDGYLSPDFPNCPLFNRIYANNHIVAYQSKK